MTKTDLQWGPDVVEPSGRGLGTLGEVEGEREGQGSNTKVGGDLLGNLLSAGQAGLFRLPFSLSATRPLGNVIPDLIIDLVSWCPSTFPLLKHKDVLA